MKRLSVLAMLWIFSGAALAARDFSDVEISVQDLGGGIYMLKGSGGNMGVSSGEDGLYIIDDQFAPLTRKITEALSEISPQPVRFVINTHWHGDHTGGNENFGKAGAVIVAHDNVFRRLSTDQQRGEGRVTEAAPDAALPAVTFNEQMTLHLNGDDMRVFHVANAHTDGDAIVHFRAHNVLHMGDTFFNGGYPFIDVGSGGGIDGYIAALDQGLALADARTRIIPGHGELSDKAQMTAYRDMLKKIRGRIAGLKQAGKSLEEVTAAAPTAEFDAEFGQGWIGPERIVEAIYTSLPMQPE